MVTSHNSFREYILFRSKIVLYAALALLVFGIFGLSFWIATSAENVNRFGLLLQLIGGLSLLPHVIGQRYFSHVRMLVRNLVVQVDPPANTASPYLFIEVDPSKKSNHPSEVEPEVEAVAVDAAAPDSWEPFAYYQTHNLPIVLGNLLASFALMWLFASLILFPQGSRPPLEEIAFAMGGLLGFAWLNLFMLIHIFLLFQVPAPPGIMAWFFSIDLGMSVIGLLIAGIIYALLNWFARSVGYIFRNGVRRVLLMVTLPFVLTGVIFEILATFL